MLLKACRFYDVCRGSWGRVACACWVDAPLPLALVRSAALPAAPRLSSNRFLTTGTCLPTALPLLYWVQRPPTSLPPPIPA